MATKLPHEYTVTLRSPRAGDARVRSGRRPVLDVGPPPEFDGTPDVWSPEHLLLGALATCYTTTFRALAARAALPVVSLDVQARGTLEKTSEGLQFTAFALDVRAGIDGAGTDAVRSVLENAKRHCIVSNSVRAPVTLSLDVVAFAASDPLGPQAL